MTSLTVLLLLLPVCWLSVSGAATSNTSNTSNPSNPSNTSDTSDPGSPGTPPPGGERLPGLSVDSSMIQRALYVLIFITMVGVLYFLVRAVRLKKPAQKKKYGLLSNYDDSVEMEAVESDEDDTLYEARSLRR